jgi:hypothetical protein
MDIAVWEIVLIDVARQNSMLSFAKMLSGAEMANSLN